MFRWPLFAVLFMLIAVAGCPSQSASTKAASKEKIYDIKGKVIWAKAAENKVRLDHEPIPGWMDAMEMTFKVEDAKVLEGLKEGDRVQGKLKKLEDDSYFITQLQKQ